MTEQNWVDLLGWGSPVGMGIFFVGLGVFFVCGSAALYFLAKTGRMDFGKQN